MSDLIQAIRMLRRNPGFTLLASITLALGIGANAVIFSIVNAVILAPLPFPDQQRIVQISDGQVPSSLPKFTAYREQNQAFDEIGAYSETGFQTGATTAATPEELHGAHVTAGWFNVLGVHPARGRFFTAGEDRPGGAPVAILSHGLWQHRFASDPEILGKAIPVDGAQLTVVGIMPAGFDFPNESQIWVPRVFEHSAITRKQIDGGAGYLSVLARLKPGVPIQKATAELETISRRYAAAHIGNLDADRVPRIVLLKDELVEYVKPTLLMLFGAVGLVLLIAASNVANLLLVRGAERRRETAIRAALGASRGHLIRQLLVENLLISLIGSALGLLLAGWGVGLIGTLSGDILPRAADIRIDLPVLAFSVMLAAFTSILFGIAPSLAASRIDLNRALREGAKTSGTSRESSRLRGLMLGSQVALALVLSIGAGLLMQSLLRLQAVDPGFRPQRLLTAHIALPPGRYPEKPMQTSFYTALLDRIGQAPGVDSAALTSALPFVNGGVAYFFQIEGRPSLGPSKDPFARLRIVSPSYLRTMGIRLRSGRDFNEDDNESGTAVVEINETMARRYWPGENPVGRKITYSREHVRVEIIGVVSDVKFGTLDSPPEEEMYVPYRQRPALAMSVVVRSTADPAPLTSAVRLAVLTLDKDQPITNIRTMENLVSGSLSQSRLRGWLMGIFAVLALILAAIGIFGVVAYTVTQRTREIGIRIALGAARSNILALVLQQTMRPVVFGILTGWLASVLAARLISSMLFGIKVLEPITIATATLTLALVAGLAAYLPARRASKVDPLIALREE